MKEKERDIEEMIADAKAEEEVAREQERAARAAKEEKAREDFRDTLREQLKDVLKVRNDESKVTIPLSEYVILKQKEADLDRILNALVDDLELNYVKDALRIRGGERAIEAIRVLYPEAYDTLLAAEIDRAEREGE